MPVYKVTAPAGTLVHGPHDHNNLEPKHWWVDGVLYVDTKTDWPLYAYFLHRGYELEEVDTVPDEYTDRVYVLKAEARETGLRPPVALQDTTTPTALAYEGA